MDQGPEKQDDKLVELLLKHIETAIRAGNAMFTVAEIIDNLWKPKVNIYDVCPTREAQLEVIELKTAHLTVNTCLFITMMQHRSLEIVFN